jgi:hypothetical protein
MVVTVRTWLAALPHDKGFLLDGFPRTRTQAPTLTADACLAKPVDFATLLKLVEHYCGQCRQRGM